ncbi:MAG: bifunctional acetaldehyde-CoA/alcohol dehydrogenase [Mycoplasmataceae bacterium]|nr:bifunctional acetaldehyde-CoA/alcohol dehydrogenase [Mycoplasmataceae bacterium]
MPDKNIVNNSKTLQQKLKDIRDAQKVFSTYTQEQVDKIFLAVAVAADKARIPLAKMAVRDTGMGVVEDKVIKNHYAAEYIYNAYKNRKTCGIIERDPTFGWTKIAEPVGLIAAIIPTTNPTSTTIFKILIALKTRNGLIISPHPRAKKCTISAAKIMYDAALRAGAPKNIIGWIDEPSVELSNQVMKEADLILATGGPGMVRAAYSSGKPAIGVGPGNVPVIIASSANIRMAVSSILMSKTFDNGMICASEQSVIVLHDVYDKFKKEMIYQGAYVLTENEAKKVGEIIIINGALNPKIVGQSAFTIAKMAGVKVPETAKILIAEVISTDFLREPFAHEKLSPCLAMYRAKTFENAMEKADHLIAQGGLGHTASLFINHETDYEKIQVWQARMLTCRCLVNSPSSQGGIGDLFNFKLPPSLTLGCGSWGGNSVSENVGIDHLLNVKIVACRRENMLWYRVPEKIYFKRGSLAIACREFKEVYKKKRAFIVTDKFLYYSGFTKEVTKYLDEMGMQHATFFDVEPDPSIETAQAGAEAMKTFQPDLIIAIGGGSPIDAAKIMWVLYEHPEVVFQDLAMRFMDIRKRITKFPHMGEKAYFCAIPTTSGTGSEVTPFAVITDSRNHLKYPLADYELLPKMAIIDPDLTMNVPPGLTAASGIDALTHALEALVSVMASDYTNGTAREAVRLILKYLPSAYTNGAKDVKAREEMANASCMAGIAFANAFLGVCHSMAHKLGSYHHLPHGIANALLINEVIKYNCSEAPVKMGIFSQYKYPQGLKRYSELAEYIGIGGKTPTDKVMNLIKEIDKLKVHLHIPLTIKEAGVKEADFLKTIDKMAEDAFDDQCTGANPRYPLINEIKAMFLNAYYGKKTVV